MYDHTRGPRSSHQEGIAVDLTPHPAKFSPQIMDTIVNVFIVSGMHMVEEDGLIHILDPFAGVGNIHAIGDGIMRRFDEKGINTRVFTDGVELEPEWAEQGDLVCTNPYHALLHASITGDFFEPPTEIKDIRYEAVITSPTYGNRMADHHNARDGSKRLTYKHRLGRDLSHNNSGAMQWGPVYQAFHHLAWKRCWKHLLPGGLLILNVKDHIRQGQIQQVSKWHRENLEDRGFIFMMDVRVPVSGMGFGEHQQTLKIDYEHVYVFRKPGE